MNVTHLQPGLRFSPALHAVIERVLDPVHGLFTEFTEERISRQTGEIRIVRARLASPAYFRENAPSPIRTANDGCGAAFDFERAYWSAIGEGVERYAGSLYWAERLVVGCKDDLDDPIDLEPLIRSGRPEIQRYCPDAIYRWVGGHDLASRRPVYVPASLVFLGYRPSGAHEILAQNDSTGLACGQDFDDACLRALCELIERDAFAAGWMLDRRPPELRLSPDDMAFLSKPVRNALLNPHVPVRLFYLANSFGVHVVTAVMRGARTQISVGAAAGLSLVQSVEKAVAEVLQGWQALGSLPETGACLQVEDLKTPFDHLRFYLHPDRIAIVDGYFSGAEEIDFKNVVTSPPQSPLEYLVERLSAAGYRAVAIDLTTDDTAELGFKVARVVVPGLQPLIFGPAASLVVDDRRLKIWQGIWGNEANDRPVYNPWPHPFP
ncbi:YcaO-like family protein [Asticcacaulis sp.]|uniref:YcaO-like family protein n=1 Tax=Asticcacaulis sp. TaxID=1872648 RepID=UPI003F7B3CEF